MLLSLKAIQKQRALSEDLTLDNVEIHRIEGGKSFQTVGAQYLKALHILLYLGGNGDLRRLVRFAACKLQ